jgi:hypothetical protein
MVWYKRTSAGLDSLILQSQPFSSGDLLRRPGSEERVSLISSTEPETGAYYWGGKVWLARVLFFLVVGKSRRTMSEAAFTLSTAPIWSAINK